MLVNGDQLLKNRMVHKLLFQQNMAKITFSLPDQIGPNQIVLEITF